MIYKITLSDFGNKNKNNNNKRFLFEMLLSQNDVRTMRASKA